MKFSSNFVRNFGSRKTWSLALRHANESFADTSTKNAAVESQRVNSRVDVESFNKISTNGTH